MSGIEKTLNRARAFAISKGWRPARLAQEAGLHSNTLRDLHEPNWSPRADTLRKLESIIPLDFEPSEAA